MTQAEAIKILIETAEAYLLINSDDGILEPEEKERIETAMKAAKWAD